MASHMHAELISRNHLFHGELSNSKLWLSPHDHMWWKTLPRTEAAWYRARTRAVRARPSYMIQGFEPELYDTGLEPELYDTGLEPELYDTGFKPELLAVWHSAVFRTRAVWDRVFSRSRAVWHRVLQKFADTTPGPTWRSFWLSQLFQAKPEGLVLVRCPLYLPPSTTLVSFVIGLRYAWFDQPCWVLNLTSRVACEISDGFSHNTEWGRYDVSFYNMFSTQHIYLKYILKYNIFRYTMSLGCLCRTFG